MRAKSAGSVVGSSQRNKNGYPERKCTKRKNITNVLWIVELSKIVGINPRSDIKLI